METSRRLVEKTLACDAPSRIPRNPWVLAWAGIHHPDELARINQRFPSDIATAPAYLSQPPRTQGIETEPGSFTDEWGCTFINIQRGVIGEVKEPLIRTWDDLPRVRPPVERLSVDVAQVNAFCRASDKYILAGTCPRPFERMQFLRGSQNLYLDLGEESPQLFALIDQVQNFFIREMELWAGTEVDALNMMDDWGAQQRLLISPRQWRRILNPCIRHTWISPTPTEKRFSCIRTDIFLTSTRI